MKSKQTYLSWLLELQIQWLSALALASLGIVFTALLTSCSTTPYPKNWKPVVNTYQNTQTNVSGLFYNLGEAADYTGCDKSARTIYGLYGSTPTSPSLYYDLHAHHYGYPTFYNGIPTNIDPANAKYIRIEQCGDHAIKIQLYSEIPGANEKIGLLKEDVLNDISWGSEGLKIGGDSVVVVMFVGNIFATETRTLNKTADGSLVMKIEFHNFGNYAVIPCVRKSTSWFRWQAVGQDVCSKLSAKPIQ